MENIFITFDIFFEEKGKNVEKKRIVGYLFQRCLFLRSGFNICQIKYGEAAICPERLGL